MYHEFGVVDSVMKYDLRHTFVLVLASCFFLIFLVRGRSRGNTTHKKKKGYTLIEWDDYRIIRDGNITTRTTTTTARDNMGNMRGEQHIHFTLCYALLTFFSFFPSFLITSSFHVLCRKYYVGSLVSNELPIFPEPTAFHRTVKNRVEGYFKSKGKDPKVQTYHLYGSSPRVHCQ